MAKRNPIPTYRHHARTGRAIVSVYHADGSRHDILLPGEYNSEESRQEYERVLATLRTNGGCLPAPNEKSKVDLSVAELILRFMTEHVASYYVDPVTRQPTTEQIAMKQAMRPLKRLYGYLPAAELGAMNLKTVRESMVSGEWMNAEEKAERVKAKQQIGLARTTVNKHIGRIKLLFRWAVENEHVPSAVLVELQAVAGLRRGRSSARENRRCKTRPHRHRRIDLASPAPRGQGHGAAAVADGNARRGIVHHAGM